MPAVMQEVHSSNVASVGYEPETKTLLVTWKSGKTSAYSGVDAALASDVRNSWSVGEALNSMVKGVFPHRYV